MAVVSDKTDSCNLLGFLAGDWSGLRCAALSHRVGYKWEEHGVTILRAERSGSFTSQHCIKALKLWSVTHVSCVQYSKAQGSSSRKGGLSHSITLFRYRSNVTKCPVSGVGNVRDPRLTLQFGSVR